MDQLGTSISAIEQGTPIAAQVVRQERPERQPPFEGLQAALSTEINTAAGAHAEYSVDGHQALQAPITPHHQQGVLYGSPFPAYPWRQHTTVPIEMKQGAPTGPSLMPNLGTNESKTPKKPGGTVYATTQPGTGFTVMRAAYLQSLPEHAYVMPPGPALNFTLPDIFVLLPLWFKNTQIVVRALNNGVNSSVHFEILRQHRVLDIPESELARLKDAISDNYRRTMRRFNIKWTKVSHKAPENWNPNDLSVNYFVPDTPATGSSQPQPPVAFNQPIPFKDLMGDVEKLPQGPDAGDLTRAVDFAMNNQKRIENGEVSEWMFPTDIHSILNHIGYTNITGDHLDGSVVARYLKTSKQSAYYDRKRRRDLEAAGLPAPAPKRRHVAKAKTSGPVAPQHEPHPQQESPNVQTLRPLLPQLPVVPDFHAPNSQCVAMQPPGIRIVESTPPSQHVIHAEGFWDGSSVTSVATSEPSSGVVPAKMKAELSTWDEGEDPFGGHGHDLSNLDGGYDVRSDIETTEEVDPVLSGTEGAEEVFTFGMEDVSFHDIDELLAGHQQFDFSDLFTPSPETGVYPEPEANALGETVQTDYTQYAFDHYLRSCVEADDYEDFSDLARAGRWCRVRENLAWHYTVSDLGFVVALMNMMEDAD